MGTWGKAILQDDLALDVYDDFIERFNEGGDPRKLHKELLAQYGATTSATEDDPNIWFGLARAQWECGALSPVVLRQVQRIVSSGADAARWDLQDRKRRQRLLNAFLVRISSPNSKPRHRVQRTVPKAVFQPGTCLAVKTYMGGYGAAIVLQIKANRYDTLHLVGGLKGIHTAPPTMAVYEKRNWLRLTHHEFSGRLHFIWCGASSFRRDAKVHPIAEVGKTALKASDSRVIKSLPNVGHSSWGWIENQIWRQHEWDKNRR